MQCSADQNTYIIYIYTCIYYKYQKYAEKAHIIRMPFLFCAENLWKMLSYIYILYIPSSPGVIDYQTSSRPRPRSAVSFLVIVAPLACFENQFPLSLVLVPLSAYSWLTAVARCSATSTFRLACRSLVCCTSASAMPRHSVWVEIAQRFPRRWPIKETRDAAMPLLQHILL